MPKQLHVNLFEMNCVGHIVQGMWVHPDNNRHRFNDLEFWTELAQLLEYGTIDGLFLADVVGAYDRNDGLARPLSIAHQIPNNDPLLLIPAMAQVTKNLGFGATFSTSYEPPFAFARRASTLDHLTKGRFAWNIVTSYLPNAALNFGLEGEIPHDRRYEIADEYLDVLYKLWEGSWDDDAVIQDRENVVYTDPKKVRYIDHVGEYFKVKGPHLSQPSRQRTPVLYQATGSPAGIEFAGRHAEVVFTGGRTQEHVRLNIANIRSKAQAHGRNPDHVKFVVQAGVITGRTDLEVTKKVEAFRKIQENNRRLGLSRGGPGGRERFAIDLSKYAPEETIGKLIARRVPGHERLARMYLPHQTVAQVAEERAKAAAAIAAGEAAPGGLREGRFFVAATPKIVVDEIEKWLDQDGIDGINLRQYLSFETARDFVELIVPELRRRGRFRTSYNDGETLRERLFGAGNARLFPNHFGARYRDPANLAVPREPLKFPEPQPELEEAAV